MNILFVYYIVPHLTQTSMYSDLVNEFKNNGHKVLVIAPKYSTNVKTGINLENNVEVLRLKSLNIYSKNIFLKGLSNLFLSYYFKKNYNRFWLNTKVDLIITSTPSILLYEFVNYVKTRNNARLYLMQKDIFPQNAVDLGFLSKNSFLYKYFKKKELKFLHISDIIGCTSNGNIDYFKKNYNTINKNKLKLLYNCTKLIIPDYDSQFKYFDNNFRVVIAGNMGKPQQLTNILNLAKKCLKYKNVIFYFIGNGSELKNIQKITKDDSISNIKFFNNLPRFEYFKILKTSNIGLISLNEKFTVPNTPMKLNDYLNAEIPVLASIDRGNDLANLLIENNMGRFAYADSPEDLFFEFELLYNDKNLCKEMGANGFNFCINNLSVESGYINIINHLSCQL